MRLITFLLLVAICSCSIESDDDRYNLMVLEPGHFHASLVQKTMYPQVSADVYVYAPDGPELQDYLNRVNDYNTRESDATSWNEIIYAGEGFAEKMFEESKGDILILSGNNARKTDYISDAVEAGLHVLADKPMVIDPDKYVDIVKAIDVADSKGVLLYDIMTERYEVTTRLQRLLSQDKEIFGEILPGSPEEPSVVKESVHYLSKKVSGKQLIRPAWFLDVSQQGEPLADVGTHLVDLVLWTINNEKSISAEDVEVVSAKNWSTDLNQQQFSKITGVNDFPDDLAAYINEDSILQINVNGETTFKVHDIYSKIAVRWGYEAEVGGDTHYSLIRGTKADLIIVQGQEQNYRPELYIVPRVLDNDLSTILQKKAEDISGEYPGVNFSDEGGSWRVNIPDDLRVGHEAHFSQVTRKYLEYLEQGSLPEWEVDFMKVKYYITTQATSMANQNQ